MKLELTDKERLFLANQYEILGLLKSEDHYLLKAETLRDGHKWLYEYFDYLSEELPSYKADHVISILGIYGDLQASYDKLTDKSGIEEHEVIFLGFDGNNECDLLGFAESLRKHSRFDQTLGKHTKNSHMPTTDIYNRMIMKWEELGKPNYPYNKEIITEILAARKFAV